MGRNIYSVLCSHFPTFGCTRNQHERSSPGIIYFDIERETSWNNIIEIGPDIIINSIGYGVVKYQQDFERMKQINYYLPHLLKLFLDEHLPGAFWIQIGTAFEYDLRLKELHENSAEVPLTDYGITKLLFSCFLKASETKNFLILRPFAMFGPEEDPSKIIPALIVAQKDRNQIGLSSGLQKRDYFFVLDLANFILTLIKNKLESVAAQVINVGSNQSITLRELANSISQLIPEFDPTYWQWGKINQRANETEMFFNASEKCRCMGFVQTSKVEAFKKTINYYYQREI